MFINFIFLFVNFRPVGMPIMQQVLVQNTDTKNSLHLLSISGSTVHFHCSFFQDKVSVKHTMYISCNTQQYVNFYHAIHNKILISTIQYTTKS